MKELKVIVDTNVFISGLIGKGIPKQIFEAFLDCKFTSVLSLEMLLELLDVLEREELKKYFKKEEVKRLKTLINSDTIFVLAKDKVFDCRDPKDNHILSCAVESKPDFVVTGDKDLLVLSPYRGIPIITPREFLKKLKKGVK